MEIEGYDYLICKICGSKMKRVNINHLRTHNMNVEEYKEKFQVEYTTCEKVRKKMNKNGKVGRKPGFKHSKKHKEYMKQKITGKKYSKEVCEKKRKSALKFYSKCKTIGWNNNYEVKPYWYKTHNYGDNWFQIRMEILKRWNYSCVDCGTNKKRLFVHHKIPFKYFLLKFSGNLEQTRKIANTFCNLVPVCYSCHMVRERKIQKSIK